MDAALIYNVTRRPERDWQYQIDCLVRAFAKAHIKLCPVDNTSAYDYIQKYFRYITFVFFWDHDHLLAEHIEMLNIPVFDNSQAIRLGSDKASMFLKLKKYHIPVPRTVNVPYLAGEDPTRYFKAIEDTIRDARIEYPFLLRRRFFVNDEQQFLITSDLYLKKVLSLHKDVPLIAQQVLSRLKKGIAFRYYVVGRRVVAAVEVFHQGNNPLYVTKNEVIASIRKTDRGLKVLAVRAARAIGAAFAAVDIAFSEKGAAMIQNINIAPYFFLVEQVAKVDIALILARYCRKHLKRARYDLL